MGVCLSCEGVVVWEYAWSRPEVQVHSAILCVVTQTKKTQPVLWTSASGGEKKPRTILTAELCRCQKLHSLGPADVAHLNHSVVAACLRSVALKNRYVITIHICTFYTTSAAQRGCVFMVTNRYAVS